MKKMFLDYVSPEVEVINVQVERGIAMSDGDTGIGDMTDGGVA